MKTEEIKKIIADILERMKIPFDSLEVKDEGGRECFCVKTADSHLLIGTKGANLFALNHIVKKMVTKGEEPASDFSIDVNNYQESAIQNIKTMAQIMGERARSFKTSVELEPMSSYERMVVHTFFEGAKDLKTESIGQGEHRRVVIKYVEPL